MTAAFVPFLPKPTARDTDAFTIGLTAEKQGPTPVPRQLAACASSEECDSSKSGTDPSTHEPKVTLRHEGDRVTSIRIDCACGKVIDLNCSY